MAQVISPQDLVRPARQSRAGALSRPAAGVDTRRALEGTLALPLFSARTAGRHSITVEFFRTGGVDAVVQTSEHLISVVTRDLPRLLQCRDGVSSERRVGVGDVIVTPAGTPKRWSHGDAAEYIALRLQPEFLSNLHDSEPASRGASVRLVDNFGTRDPHLQSLAGRLLREVRTSGFGNLIYTEALAIEFGIHLLRQYCDADHGSNDRIPEATPRLAAHKLRRAKEFIREHLGEDLTLDRIAGELAMSPFHFAHAFRQTTGVSPHRYVMDCRIDRAMRLLRETELPVSEVGQEVGIPSPSHFSLLFRRSTGSTPTRYRAEH
jgi:AraC family transcriptional regulator